LKKAKLAIERGVGKEAGSRKQAKKKEGELRAQSTWLGGGRVCAEQKGMDGLGLEKGPGEEE